MRRLIVVVVACLVGCDRGSAYDDARAAGDALAAAIALPHVDVDLEPGLPDAARLFVTGTSIVYDPTPAFAHETPSDADAGAPSLVVLDPSRRSELADLPATRTLVYADAQLPAALLGATLAALPGTTQLVVVAPRGVAALTMWMGDAAWCPDDTHPMPTEPSPPSECGTQLGWEVRAREVAVTSNCPAQACAEFASEAARWDGATLVMPDAPSPDTQGGLDPTVAACLHGYAQMEPNLAPLMGVAPGVDTARLAAVMAVMSAAGQRRTSLCTAHPIAESIAGAVRALDRGRDPSGDWPVRGSVSRFPAPVPPFETVIEPRSLGDDAERPMASWLSTRAPFYDAAGTGYLRARDRAGNDVVMLWVVDGEVLGREAVGVSVLVDGARVLDLPPFEPASDEDARAFLSMAIQLATSPWGMRTTLYPGMCRLQGWAIDADTATRVARLRGMSCEGMALYEATFDATHRAVVTRRGIAER